MSSLQCIVGPSRLASELGVRTFYAGTAPASFKSPIVAPQRPGDPPVPSWRQIEEQEGRLYGTPTRKVPRNLKHPLTHDTYSPTRLFDPELLNRHAVPSEYAMVQWLVLKEGARLKSPDESGPHWLAKDHPFPLNPSFKPPKPQSDTLRTRIYDYYVQELKKAAAREELAAEDAAREDTDLASDEDGLGKQDHAEALEGAAEAQKAAKGSDNVTERAEGVSRPAYEQPWLTFKDELILRSLSAKYSLSIDRLRAIIRLKAFERRRQHEGKQPQAHFQEVMERIMGVHASLEANFLVDEEAAAASERVSKAVQPIVEMLEADGGERSLVQLLQPAPSQERKARELPVETVIPLRREGVVLSYCDTTDTPKGRVWERANTGRKSRSVHARKAAYLTRLANLGRLPRELYRGKSAEHMRPPPEAAAQYF